MNSDKLNLYTNVKISTQAFTTYKLSVKLDALFLQHLTRKFNLKEPSTIIYHIDIRTFKQLR